MRIDHIFVGSDIAVEKVEIPSSTLTRVASDHLPLIADLHIDVASIDPDHSAFTDVA